MVQWLNSNRGNFLLAELRLEDSKMQVYQSHCVIQNSGTSFDGRFRTSFSCVPRHQLMNKYLESAV